LAALILCAFEDSDLLLKEYCQYLGSLNGSEVRRIWKISKQWLSDDERNFFENWLRSERD
jgi:heme oxygenase